MKTSLQLHFSRLAEQKSSITIVRCYSSLELNPNRDIVAFVERPKVSEVERHSSLIEEDDGANQYYCYLNDTWEVSDGMMPEEEQWRKWTSRLNICSVNSRHSIIGLGNTYTSMVTFHSPTENIRQALFLFISNERTKCFQRIPLVTPRSRQIQEGKEELILS